MEELGSPWRATGRVKLNVDVSVRLRLGKLRVLELDAVVELLWSPAAAEDSRRLSLFPAVVPAR